MKTAGHARALSDTSCWLLADDMRLFDRSSVQSRPVRLLHSLLTRLHSFPFASSSCFPGTRGAPKRRTPSFYRTMSRFSSSEKRRRGKRQSTGKLSKCAQAASFQLCLHGLLHNCSVVRSGVEPRKRPSWASDWISTGLSRPEPCSRNPPLALSPLASST